MRIDKKLGGYEVHTPKIFRLVGILGLTSLNAWSVVAQSSGGALEEIIVTAQRREEDLQSTPVSVAVFGSERLRDLSVVDTRALAEFVPNLSIGNGTGRSSDVAALSIRGVNEALLSLIVDPAVGIYIDDVYFGRPQLSFLKLIDVERVEVLRGPQGTLFGKNTTGGAVRYITKKPEFDELGGYVSTTMGDFGRIDVSGAVNVPFSDTLAVRLKAASLSREGYIDRLADGERLGAESAIYGSAQLRWRPSDRVDLNVTLDYTKRDTDLGPHKLIDYFRYNNTTDISPPLQSPGAAGSGAWNLQWGNSPFAYRPTIPASLYEVAGTGVLPRLESESAGLGVNLAFNINDRMTFRSITGLRDVDDFRRQDFDDVAFAFMTFDATVRDGVDSWSQEFQLSGSSDRMSWIGGVYFSKEEPFVRQLESRDARAANAFGALINQNTSLQTTDSTGVYAQATFDVTERLALTAGIRHSEDDKKFETGRVTVLDRQLVAFATQLGLTPITVPPSLGCDPVPTGSCVSVPTVRGGQQFSSTTPRLALEFQWTDDVMTYVAASEGFKAGGTNDNPLDVRIAFEPEEVLSYELGVRTQFADDRIRLNATYFTMDYDNKQITVAPTTAQAGFINPCIDRCILNAGDGEIDGWELESLFAVTERFQLHANVATLDAKWVRVVPGSGVSLSSGFALAPDLSYNVGGRFDAPTNSGGTVSFLFDWSYKDEQETSPQDSTTLTVPDYTLSTLRLKYTTANGIWDASIFCSNCADEEYIFGGNAWGATTNNTIYPYKPLNHPAFVSGGINPNLIVVPDISYVLVGAPRMWGIDFRYNF